MISITWCYNNWANVTGGCRGALCKQAVYLFGYVKMDMINKLSEFNFFAHLSQKDLKKFAANLALHQFKIGDFVLRQGEPASQVHFLLEGSIEISTQSRDEKTAHIMCHRAPSMVGIIEIWRESPHLANAIAIEPCTTLGLNRTEFFKFLHSHHQACINIAQSLSDQIYQDGISNRIRIFGSATHVLARHLWNEAESFGEKFNGGILVKKQVNKTQLAKSLGISRRQVLREFSELESKKLIELQGDYLFIPDRNKLKNKFDEAWLERRKVSRKTQEINLKVNPSKD